MKTQSGYENKLLRYSGLAAVVAGILTAFFWFIHPDPGLGNAAARLSPIWTPLYAMFILVLLLHIFALFGLFAKHIEGMRKLGTIGFVLAVVGTALFVPAGVLDGFVAPVLATNAASLLPMTGPLFTALTPLFMIGGLCFALGIILLAIAMYQQKIMPRYAVIMWAVGSPILGMSPLMPPLARMAGSVVFGLGLAWLGYTLWKDKQ